MLQPAPPPPPCPFGRKTYYVEPLISFDEYAPMPGIPGGFYRKDAYPEVQRAVVVAPTLAVVALPDRLPPLHVEAASKVLVDRIAALIVSGLVERAKA
jgi:hypothetical protein